MSTTFELANGDTLTLKVTSQGVIMTVEEAKGSPGASPAPALSPADVRGMFSAQSRWNISPVGAVLGTDTMPASKQRPWVNDSDYSTRVYVASASDKPVTIYGPKGGKDLVIANQVETGTVVVPLFPAATTAATGEDGHCDIADPINGFLHSFFQLFRAHDGKYCATKYARIPLDGSGWGTPANPDNVRAAGCPSAGGLLRTSERGLDIVPHALAIGIDKNGFVSGPVDPATLEDWTGFSTYAGAKGQRFPMGALLMLPPGFDVNKLGLPESRAIARTMMKFGGYVVDATVDTMCFYAEIGSGWNQFLVAGKYDARFTADMEAIKAAMRQVVSASGWKDRDDKSFTPTPLRSMNLLSMRGPWQAYPGSQRVGSYNALSDLYEAEATVDARAIYAVVYPRSETKPERYNLWKQLCWHTNPEPGAKYIVRAVGEGAITAKMQVKNGAQKATYAATTKLAPGQSEVLTWPTDPNTVTEVYIDKAAGPAARIRLELIRV